MSDIVVRLRFWGDSYHLHKESADEIEKLRAVASIPKNTLERFERLVSRMVSEGYALGYREACNHIMHETIEKLGEKE